MGFLEKSYFKTILSTVFLITIVTSCSDDALKPVVVIDIMIKTPPTKILYKSGEMLDLSGLIVSLEFDNEETEDVEFSLFEERGITYTPINGVQISETTTVTITHGASGKSTIQEIVVNQVAEVIVKTPPNRVNYLRGELLELSGLEVTLRRDNGDTEDVILSEFENNSILVSEEEGTAIDETVINLTIAHSPSGKSTVQNIVISIVESIEIKKSPDNTDYYSGEYLSVDGLSIILNLDNGDIRELELSDFESYGVVTTPLNGVEITNDDSEILIMHEESGQTVGQTLTLLILTDIEGNIYEHLRIGDQIWMKENLNVTKYQNGDIIGTTFPADLDISAEVGPKYQWAFDGDNSNAAVYGRLYTKYVAADDRNVCPVGWHVPSSTEFSDLVDYLEEKGHNYDEEETSFQNKLGKSIASQSDWTTQDWEPAAPGFNSESNNSSGFTGLPAGWRSIPVNGFSSMNEGTAWWSSSSDGDDLGYALNIQFFQIAAQVGLHGDSNLGYSIRCIKD